MVIQFLEKESGQFIKDVSSQACFFENTRIGDTVEQDTRVGTRTWHRFGPIDMENQNMSYRYLNRWFWHREHHIAIDTIESTGIVNWSKRLKDTWYKLEKVCAHRSAVWGTARQ